MQTNYVFNFTAWCYSQESTKFNKVPNIIGPFPWAVGGDVFPRRWNNFREDKRSSCTPSYLVFRHLCAPGSVLLRSRWKSAPSTKGVSEQRGGWTVGSAERERRAERKGGSERGWRRARGWNPPPGREDCETLLTYVPTLPAVDRPPWPPPTTHVTAPWRTSRVQRRRMKIHTFY